MHGRLVNRRRDRFIGAMRQRFWLIIRLQEPFDPSAHLRVIATQAIEHRGSLRRIDNLNGNQEGGLNTLRINGHSKLLALGLWINATDLSSAVEKSGNYSVASAFSSQALAYVHFCRA